MQEIYKEPIKEELITKRVREIKDGGVLAAASLTPQNCERYLEAALAGGLDILIIQGTVVSAEHVSSYDKPLDLNAFVDGLDIPCIIGGCCSYQGALHLMRSGAVGVLVGVGPGHACTSRRVLGIGVPQATAIADAAAARTRFLEETGKYCHIIADGGMRTGGDLAKAIAVGADAIMIGSPLASASEAPGRGYHWGMATFHPELPRGTRVRAGIRGTLEEILLGPAHQNDGTLNLLGGLRTSMATTGYENLKTLPEGRGHGRPVAADRGQGAPEHPGRRDGPLAWRQASTKHSRPSSSSTSGRSTRSSSPVASARRGSTRRSSRSTSPPRRSLAARPAALILSGGPASVYAEGAPHMDPAVLELGIPILGFCYGIQEMALHLGGEIPKTDVGEYGFAELTVTRAVAARCSTGCPRPRRSG